MATEKPLSTVTSSWADLTVANASLASVAGLLWQNVGLGTVYLSFTTSAPGAADSYQILKTGESYYDKNGSAHAWAKSPGSIGSTLSAVAD